MRWPTILRDAVKQAKQMRIFPARSLKYKCKVLSNLINAPKPQSDR